MRAPFSFWTASLLARARFRRLFAAMSLMPFICRFAALCPDHSPQHRIHPASWRGGRIYSRGIAPELFRPWLCQKLPWESENKKSVRIATFLRLGIVVWLQIADRGVKTWKIGHKAANFRFAGAEGSP